MNDKAGKLEAKGRISEQTTYQIDDHSPPMSGVKYNVFKRVDGARLMSFDIKSNTVTIEVKHSETPSFWLEIQLPLNQLKDWLTKELEEDKGQKPIKCVVDWVMEQYKISHLNAKGKIMEQSTYQIDEHSQPKIGFKYNTSERVDGARLMSFDVKSSIVTVRVDHSETPSFWLELQIPIKILSKWCEGLLTTANYELCHLKIKLNSTQDSLLMTDDEREVNDNKTEQHPYQTTVRTWLKEHNIQEK